MKDLYSILGTNRGASAEDIKHAYRKQTQDWHPDKHGNSEEANERFRQIQSAYDVLGDPERRAAYDLTGREPSGRNVRQVHNMWFNTTGDTSQDLVVTSTSFANLVFHTVVHGGIKNTLLATLGITAAVTAGWWGILLAVAAFGAMTYSSANWIKVLVKSPLVGPRSK